MPYMFFSRVVVRVRVLGMHVHLTDRVVVRVRVSVCGYAYN